MKGLLLDFSEVSVDDIIVALALTLLILLGAARLAGRAGAGVGTAHVLLLVEFLSELVGSLLEVLDGRLDGVDIVNKKQTTWYDSEIERSEKNEIRNGI